jgi:hypothetical protein
VEKDCRNCEWYDRQRRPGAALLDGRAPYCVALGFYLMGNHAPECRLYRPRPGVTTREQGAP